MAERRTRRRGVRHLIDIIEALGKLLNGLFLILIASAFM
jgi:hypothetical protein